MLSFNKYLFLISILVCISCKTSESAAYKSKQALKNNYLSGNSIAIYEGISDSTFVKLKNFSNGFIFDMKYATEDNFLKQKVYACEECYLRLKTVKFLIPNADYVADPKKGSVHNRGGAVDITLVDAKGKELDMGTPFDFFGPEASHNYQGFSNKISKNRIYLKEVMLQNNFKSFDSEWWHYNLSESTKDKLANFQWKCN